MMNFDLDNGLNAKLVLQGTWLYDMTLEKQVRIYRLNFDFYYEIDKDYLEPGQLPKLNSEGHQYVITWNDQDEFTFASDPTEGSLSLNEAVTKAESIVKQRIQWI